MSLLVTRFACRRGLNARLTARGETSARAAYESSSSGPSSTTRIRSEGVINNGVKGHAQPSQGQIGPRVNGREKGLNTLIKTS